MAWVGRVVALLTGTCSLSGVRLPAVVETLLWGPLSPRAWHMQGVHSEPTSEAAQTVVVAFWLHP